MPPTKTQDAGTARGRLSHGPIRGREEGARYSGCDKGGRASDPRPEVRKPDRDAMVTVLRELATSSDPSFLARCAQHPDARGRKRRFKRRTIRTARTFVTEKLTGGWLVAEHQQRYQAEDRCRQDRWSETALCFLSESNTGSSVVRAERRSPRASCFAVRSADGSDGPLDSNPESGNLTAELWPAR